MNIESIRDYCLTLPRATEDFPFDDTTLVFRIEGKIFALVDLERHDRRQAERDPEYAETLREHHAEVEPGWHMNKRYWNMLNLVGCLSDELICHLIRHSYNQVLKKFSHRMRESMGLEFVEE